MIRNGFLFFMLFGMLTLTDVEAQNNSVLSSGDWYKFGFIKKDLYKISGNDLIASGIDISTVNPENIRLFGNGAGGMLPQANNAERKNDLVENPILIIGGEDGTFDPTDIIIFYGNEANRIFYNEDELTFDIEQNIYADSAFVFLTFSSEAIGTRVGLKPAIRDPDRSFDSFNAYEILAEDKESRLSQGREWYGDGFSFFRGNSNAYEFPIENSLGNWRLKVDMMGGSFEPSSFSINTNGGQNFEIDVPTVPDELYEDVGRDVSQVFDLSPSASSSLGLTINYDFTNQESLGFVDYIVFNYDRRLRYENRPLLFRNIASQTFDRVSYDFDASAGTYRVWDVSDPVVPKEVGLNLINGVYSFTDAPEEEIKEYIFFSPGEVVSTPEFVGKLSNQNLHAISNVDALIVTHQLFLSEATRLANYRSSQDGLNIAVVTVDQIYNEFSGGAQDITAIRDLTKHIYDRSASLKYLLLFGDCSYDYKDRIERKTNFVPTYEARESLRLIESYSSEDYYGFLEDGEGDWIEGNNSTNHSLDIGIGRLPVNDIEQAKNAVDKIIFYEQESSRTNWRNAVYFVADDGDGNRHQSDAESLSTLVDDNHLQVEVKKLYLDTFEQLPDPGGEKSPEANRAVLEAFDKGGLIINYSGHGNENKLGDEDVLLAIDVVNITNKKRMPLLVTATCQFGKYDNPFLVSGAERLMNSESGGAIAMLTSTRPVYAQSNLVINRAFYNQVFEKEGGSFRRLGEIIRDTKNNSLQGIRNRNFTLLGDPMMTLNYPKNAISIQSNGLDTLNALELVKLQGQVDNVEGNVDTNFNGSLSVAVFDKLNEKATFGTEGSAVFRFQERSSVLFRGEVTVTNGVFDIDFVVPKNIRYNFDQGRVAMYAFDDERGIDAAGGFADFVVGGSVDLNVDEQGPSISLFLNEEDAGFSREVGANPMLIVHLADENGINLTDNGLNQFITATLDGEDEFVMNDFYNADLDTYQSGKIFFPLNGLREGEHRLEIKAWDTYNNSSVATVIFNVSGEGKLFLTNAKNFPNPFAGSTSFTFVHDRVDEDLTVQLSIIDLHGGIVYDRMYDIPSATREVSDLLWDKSDSNGGQVMPGVYLYKLVVISGKDGATGQFYSRLVVEK